MKSYTAILVGTVPLLMHRGELADPLDPHAKAISEIAGKRAKSEADILELARREFMGALVLDSTGRPAIKASQVEAMLVEAAKSEKKGKAVTRGVFADTGPDFTFPLEYPGPTSPADLWEQGYWLRCSARVNGRRVMRTRPQFREWGVAIALHVDEDVIDTDAVARFLEHAGRLVGLGDWRPRFGRFEVQ